MKTKSIGKIEKIMDGLDPQSMRYRILECAKEFKTSWINLGQSLYSVHKDKLYRSWGYTDFDAYAVREIGIRKNTAVKLLKSYFFLEKEEPGYLKSGASAGADVARVPSFESVDILRRAKSRVDPDDYTALRENVLEKGKGPSEVRKDLTAIIKRRKELEPDQARIERRRSVLKRMAGLLYSLKEEARVMKFLKSADIRQIESIINKLRREISDE
jgi:hypothetical protein